MDIDERIIIHRPASEVFSFLADFANDPRWRRDVRAMIPDPAGPAQLATAVHEELRFGGRTHHTDTTVTEVDPGRLVAFAGNGTGGAVAGRRTVHSHPGGTEVRLELHVATAGALRRLEPLLGPLFRRGVRRDLRALRQILEDQTRTSEAGGASKTAVASRR